MERGLRADAADFYRLTAEQLVELEGFGRSRAERLVARDRGVRRSARSAACCSRSGSRGSATVTGRNLAAAASARSTRCSAATPEEIERDARASARTWPSSIHDQLADERMRDADRATCARRAAASRRRARRPARGRWPARRSC